MDRRYKVVLLGEGRVGKTSILLRYVKNAFDDRQASTLSAAFLEKSIPIGGGEAARACIWDTAGQERYHALSVLYYRDSDGALLVYDITDEASFGRVKEWVKELRKILGDDVTIAIVGNKADMEKNRHVDREEAIRYAQSVGAGHSLTSAKSGAGIEEAFSELMKRIVAKRRAAAGAAAGGRGPAAGAGGPGGMGGAAAGAGGAGDRKSRITIVDDEPAPKSGCC